MFRFPQPAASRAATPDRTRHLLRRAVLFGIGLILLWVALQLAPKRTPLPGAVPVAEASDADDGVAFRSRPATTMPGLFSAGNIVALVLLAGGGGVAFFLRRRAKEGGSAAMLLETLGHMSLAQNQQLRLVRCGDDVLLLGVTSGQITLLKSYPHDEFGRIQDSSSSSNGTMASAQPTNEASFARLLRQQAGTSLTFNKSAA